MRLPGLPALLPLALLIGIASGARGQLAPRDWKGTNWFACIGPSVDNVYTYLPGPLSPFSTMNGRFQEEVMAAEVARMAASGLNSIRLIPSFWAYVIDRQAYMDTLRRIAQACNAYGIEITYMVWSAIGLNTPFPSRDGVMSPEPWHDLIHTDAAAATCPELYATIAARSHLTHNVALAHGPLPAGEAIFASLYHDPGNELIAISADPHAWPYDMGARVDAYLDSIASFFATDPDGIASFGSYDLFNEPNGGAEISGAPIEHYLAFCAYTRNRLLATHPGAPCTIGWAGAGPEIDALDARARAYGAHSEYLSFHSYSGPEAFERCIAQRRTYAAGLGMDAVVSEFHRNDFTAGRLGFFLETLRRHGVGGQMWGFLQSNSFGTHVSAGYHAIDGVFRPEPAVGGAWNMTVVNALDEAAVRSWTSSLQVANAHTSLGLDSQVLASDRTAFATGGQPFKLHLTSNEIGSPVTIFATMRPVAAPACVVLINSPCSLVLGLGFLHGEPLTQALAAGVVPATGWMDLTPGATTPPGLSGVELVLQAVVGAMPAPAFFALNTSHLTEASLIRFQ